MVNVLLLRKILALSLLTAIGFLASIPGSSIAAPIDGLHVKGVGKFPEDAMFIEDSQLAGDQLRMVVYGIETDAGSGYCSGVPLGTNQFLTAKHCIHLAQDLSDITMFGAHCVQVEEVSDLPGVDAAMVTLNQNIFGNECATFSQEPVAEGDDLRLLTFDWATLGVHQETLLVQQTNYEAFNPDLNLLSKGIIRAEPLDGSSTVDGDSGAPVFVEGRSGMPLLAGTVVGVSKKNGQIMVQPLSPLVEELLEGCACCENVDDLS